MPLQTSAERPAPVRTISALLGDWIGRLGAVWVEGQVTQVTARPGATTAFLVLRDTDAELSLPVTCHRRVLDALAVPLSDGTRVVVHGRPLFYPARGSLSMSVDAIRPVGVGELLARLEHLRRVLTAEGLFAAERKRALPFLPRTVGLVCGRASAAERDVVENARRRWPAVRFRVREVAVQGPSAVPEVVAAIQDLDADAEVDVVVITRGGGSLEDLLPFSNETLLRAAFACVTPLVSAIGHEADTPLLDLVADVRASTPTDAAKRVVPDVGEEVERVRLLRERSRRTVVTWLEREQAGLNAVRSRPVLADPDGRIAAEQSQVAHDLDRARRALASRLERAADDLGHCRARARSLSPAATLERGYAVVQRRDGGVVRRPSDVEARDPLRIRLSSGELAAVVAGAPVSGGSGDLRSGDPSGASHS
jgi:exodeoxyribonuclease VII large subunit